VKKHLKPADVSKTVFLCGPDDNIKAVQKGKKKRQYEGNIRT